MATMETTSGRRAPKVREERKEEIDREEKDEPVHEGLEPRPRPQTFFERYGGLIVPGVLFGLVALAILVSILVE